MGRKNSASKQKSFSIHQFVVEAIDDKHTRTELVKRLQENLKNRRVNRAWVRRSRLRSRGQRE